MGNSPKFACLLVCQMANRTEGYKKGRDPGKHRLKIKKGRIKNKK